MADTKEHLTSPDCKLKLISRTKSCFVMHSPYFYQRFLIWKFQDFSKFISSDINSWQVFATQGYPGNDKLQITFLNLLSYTWESCQPLQFLIFPRVQFSSQKVVNAGWYVSLVWKNHQILNLISLHRTLHRCIAHWKDNISTANPQHSNDWQKFKLRANFPAPTWNESETTGSLSPRIARLQDFIPTVRSLTTLKTL